MDLLFTMLSDARHGFRLIRQHPLLSAAMIATLALGVGLDAGAFTIVDGMLFRPRVRDDPSSFVQLDVRDRAQAAPAGGALPMVTTEDYLAYRDRSTAFQTLAAWTPIHAAIRSASMAAARDTIPILVTCDFFAVYDSRPLVGRVLRSEDCASPGRAPVVVIGERLWRSDYGASEAAIGRVLMLNERPFTIIGVMPGDFDGQLRGPFWVPYTMFAPFAGGADLWSSRSLPWLVMVGRLRPGASRAAASAELNVIARQQDALVLQRSSVVRLTNGSMFSMMQSPALVLSIVPLVMGALSLVLLVACANVTMLLLSRAAARQHEVAVRLSLGATRGRLVRMFLTESAVLALAALPFSVLIAMEAPAVWRARIPTLPFYPFQFDLATFAYLALTTIAAGCLAALAPALETARGSVSASLHGENALSGRRWRTADALVVLQVAVSLVLLVAAVAMLRAERSLRSDDAGFDTSHVLVAEPRLTATRGGAAPYYRDLAARVRTLRGVRAVALASAPPIGAPEGGVPTLSLRRPDGDRAVLATPTLNQVTAEYFTTLSIGIVRGRVFRDDEAAARVPPIVVSESLAASAWPGQDPIGARVEAGDGRQFDVIGIARDTRTFSDAGRGGLVAYLPRPVGAAGDALLVCFDGDAAQAARSVEAVMRDLDPDSASEPRTMSALREDLASRFMRLASVVAFLGVVAIGLAVVGLYGVTAFAAGRRMKELGIRIALGATRGDIVSLVIGSGLRSIGLGLLLGLAAAVPAARALRRAIEQVPLDSGSPAMFAACAVCLAAIALAAAAGPARRAAGADPVHALRQD